MTTGEKFHLIDARTGKFVRDAHGKPRLMAKSTFMKQQEEMNESGYILSGEPIGGVAESSSEEATGDATGDDGDSTNIPTRRGTSRVQ